MLFKRYLRVWLIPLVISTGGSVGAAGEATTATDWPQWRGPTRDGIAPAGPKLLDKWPAEGPPLVWKSEFIPGNEDGGCGSVVVADGKAFVYVNWRGPVALTTAKLIEYGWIEGIPEDLAKKIESARSSPARSKLKTEAEVGTYIKEFAANLDSKQAEQYADYIKLRLGKQAAWGNYPWSRLEGWAKLRDKEVRTLEELCVAMGVPVFHLEALTGSLNMNRTCTDSVLCLDAATGKTLWRKDFPAPPPNGRHTYGWPASSTPAVADGKCYVQGSAGLYCLAVKDGSVIWQKPTDFSNSSPLVFANAVFVMHGDALAAFGAEKGELLWKQPKLSRAYNFSVAKWTADGQDYLLGLTNDHFFCVNPKTGAILWQAPGGHYEGSTTPSVSGDFATFRGNGGVYGFKITPQGATQLWKTPPGAWRSSSALLDKDCVYDLCCDFLRCLDAKTGEVKWQKKEVNNHYASPILADGMILCPSGGRDYLYMLLLKATPEKQDSLGCFGKSQDGRHNVCCCSTPALADGRLYLRLKDGIACYDLTAK